MSISSEISRINGNIASAYTAVSGKGGTLPSARNSANLPAAIQSIPSGGTLITKTITQNGTYNASADNADGYSQVTVAVPPTPTPSEEKTVSIAANGTTVVTPTAGKLLSKVTISTNVPSDGGRPEHGVFFIDYDGTLIEAWATNEVAGKSALPANPTSHPRLVAQGWNWALDKIKSYISRYQNADLWVGQIYRTASGFSEFDITLTKGTGKTVTFKMVGNKDWGDGTTDALLEHTYADYGDYTIKCDGTSIPAGTANAGGLFGSTSSNANAYWCTQAFIGGSVTQIRNYGLLRCHSLTNVTIPDSMTSVGNNALSYCYSLKSVSLPNSMTSVGNNLLSYCYSLKSVSLPKNVTNLGTNTFYNCYSLQGVSISDGVTNLGNYMFYNCYSLTRFNIPTVVTSIGSSVFFNCYTFIWYDFSRHSSVPSLTNVNAFNSIKGNCKIIVPDALYDTWIAATNWSTYADYIYKASEVA